MAKVNYFTKLVVSILMLICIMFFVGCSNNDDGGSNNSIIGTWRDIVVGYSTFFFNADSTGLSTFYCKEEDFTWKNYFSWNQNGTTITINFCYNDSYCDDYCTIYGCEIVDFKYNGGDTFVFDGWTYRIVSRH